MQSFPFTSQVTYDEAGYPEYDRAVDSDILRNIFKNYYSNGVFPNPSTNFQVVADEGMQVVVRPGACLIEGATGYETEDRTMVVQAAGATDRIDSVVLRLNDNIDYRDIDLYVIKGNSSSEPPELTRTGGVYEIGLANLYVSANSSTITTERITDTRLVTARCGYAMPVQEFDTTALFDQLQAQVNENIELIQRAINQTEAAHLQEQIDSISSDIGTTSIASISDGTLKGAVAKHEQDVNSLNLKMEDANSNISKKQDASTAITTSNINNWMTSHIMAKTVQVTTSMNPYSFKEVTVSLGITGNYIVISVEPYVVGEAMAHITNHFLDGKGNVKIDVTNAQSTGTSTVYVGAWIRYIQL